MSSYVRSKLVANRFHVLAVMLVTLWTGDCWSDSSIPVYTDKTEGEGRLISVTQENPAPDQPALFIPAGHCGVASELAGDNEVVIDKPMDSVGKEWVFTPRYFHDDKQITFKF